MVTDAFSSILQELGKLLKIPKLEPDQNNACLIKFPNNASIQIELDRSGQNIFLGFDLGSVAPGRYRENVFAEALKSNGQLPPRHGDFSYSQKSDHLLLTELIPIHNLNGDKLLNAITPFLEKAQKWHEALAHGDIPSSLQGAYSSRGGGIFGLK